MKRGRKANPKCTVCGVTKTTENTNARATGSLLNVCKSCQGDLAYIRRLRKMSKAELMVTDSDLTWRLTQVRKELNKQRS